MLQRSTIVSSESEREAYYEQLRADNIAAAWTAQDGVMAEPHSRVVPYLWQWPVLRRHALRALELVGTMEAERRVIRCMNPGLQRGATNTLVANIQIVGPGEIARAHRHTPAALRMIIESTGGYTVVNGETVPMLPGDLVLTPNWTWHDHANDSQTPVMWLDGLDAPLINLLEARFQEEYPQETQRASEDVDLSFAKYGSGSLRPAWERPPTHYSPQMRYPWTQTREALDRLAATEAGSSHDGIILAYSNPLSGGPVMPTIACYAQTLRAGERTTRHRHTSSTVYHVIEGRGSTVVDGQRLDWGPKDIFIVPNWAWHEHRNESTTSPAYLFSFSDEPVYRALQLYHEDTGAA